MVSLSKKIVKGQTYWYAVKSARVNGNPRVVWQKYLGTAEYIAERLSSPIDNNLRIQSMPLGHVAALSRANADIQFIDIVNRNTNKKSTNGFTVGEYLLLQMIGRAEGNLSRNAIAKWYPNSIAKLVIGKKTPINTKNLLKHLDYPTEDAIRAIEDDIAQRLMAIGISPNKLIWDTTNFFTRIESGESIPQKGHSKEHRNDRNLVGLGLAVGQENIPFFHETFEAQMHDSKVFSNILDIIIDRLKRLNVDTEEIVMVLDKGNNSKDNIREAISKVHLIGTIRYDQGREYIEVPLDKFEKINDDGIMAYRTRGKLYEEDFTIVVTHNPHTRTKQMKKYEDTKKKVLKELAKLKKKIENKKRRGRPWTQTRAVRSLVDAIPMHMRSVFDYEVNKKVGRGGGLIVEFSINQEMEDLRYKSFGKMVHFTDLHEWTSQKISESYNAKYCVEDDFRWLKDKLMIPIKPINVRTDQHIRAHVFICVMGLLFYRYIQWKLKQSGLTYSTYELDDILNGIKLALVFTSSKNTKGRFVVEQMDKDQAKVFSALQMAEFISQ